MKNKLVLIVLMIIFLAACGGSSPQSGPTKVKGASGAPTTDGPTLVANQPVSQPADKLHKKPKKAVTLTPAPVPEVEPVVTPIVIQAPPPQPKAQIVAPKIPTAPYVVGMGSTGEQPSKFDDQGPSFAIQKANFCAISHKYPGGDECYLKYSDGSTKWSSADNFKDAEDFINKLKVQKAADDQARKAEKAAKKQKR